MWRALCCHQTLLNFHVFFFFGTVSGLLFQLNYYGISNLCYLLDAVGDSQKV